MMMFSSHGTVFFTLYYTRQRKMALGPFLNYATYKACDYKKVSAQSLSFFIEKTEEESCLEFSLCCN